MKVTNPDIKTREASTVAFEDELRPLLDGRPSTAQPSGPLNGVVVGQLIGLRDNRMPLVTFPGQSESRAIVARSTIELDPAQIGKDVTLLFEGGEPSKPIVTGVLRTSSDLPAPVAEWLDLSADGERLILAAKDQVVLRCGKASITLTKHGKVIIQGTYVSSQSSGVLRIKGGSVSIN